MNNLASWTDTIADAEWRLNRFDGPLGSYMEVPYSFMKVAPTSGAYAGTNFDGFRPFEAEEALAARLAMNEFEAAAGIRFEPVENDGILQFAVADRSYDRSDAVGQAFYSWRADTRPAADVWLYNYDDVLDDVTPNVSSSYHVLLHEIGHAIGLKHPGNYSDYDEGPFLPDDLDVTSTTVMSYNWDYGYGAADKTLGPLDKLAVEYLFGEPVSDGPERYSEVAPLLAIHGIDLDEATAFASQLVTKPNVVIEAAESIGLSEAMLADLLNVEEDTVLRFFADEGLEMAPAALRVDDHLTRLGVDVESAQAFVLSHLDKPEHLFFEAQHNAVSSVMLAELVGVMVSDVDVFFASHQLNADELA